MARREWPVESQFRGLATLLDSARSDDQCDKKKQSLGWLQELQQMEATQNVKRQRGRSWPHHVEARISLVDVADDTGANNVCSNGLWVSVRKRPRLSLRQARCAVAGATSNRPLPLSQHLGPWPKGIRSMSSSFNRRGTSQYCPANLLRRGGSRLLCATGSASAIVRVGKENTGKASGTRVQ